MDVTTFDRLARTVATAGTRRTALRLLLTGAGTALGLGRGQEVSAQTSCTLKTNGARCSDDAQCCSGRCRRSSHNHKKRCRQADNQGLCTVAVDACSASHDSFVCGDQDAFSDCLCWVTIRGRSFCGAAEQVDDPHCGCTSAKECEERAGKGAKCVQLNSTGCGCSSGVTSGCMPPCPVLHRQS